MRSIRYVDEQVQGELELLLWAAEPPVEADPHPEPMQELPRTAPLPAEPEPDLEPRRARPDFDIQVEQEEPEVEVLIDEEDQHASR